MAGFIGIAQTFLPQVCDRYSANGDWQAFYTAVTEKTSKFLAVMDDALREPIPVDWIEFREANAGDLLAIEFKGHQPSTAHEAVWRIGQLIANAYEWCKLTNDEALGKDCEVVNAKTLHDALKSLPFVRNKIEDRLDSELARWQRWLKDEAAKQSPKSVELQAETLAGGDGAGGAGGEADGQRTKGKRGRRKGSTASDPTFDKRVFEAWVEGHGAYHDFNEVAVAFRIERKDAWNAKERHRKRLPKSE